MKQEISTTNSDFRERVVVFLAFLTSDACMDACRRFVAPDVLAAELCRLWFDDLYVPGERYLDGLKGDRSEAALRRFDACFTDDERAALERFHGCWELRLDLAANRARGRAFFPDNDSWRSLRRHAAQLLGDLDPDPEGTRAVLAGFVREMIRRGDGPNVLDALQHRKRLAAGKAGEV